LISVEDIRPIHGKRHRTSANRNRLPKNPEVASWVDKNKKVNAYAFLPNKGDYDGLSLSHVETAVEAAITGKKGKRFFVTRLRVQDFVDCGLRVISDEPGHALVEGWTFDKRDDPTIRELIHRLAAACDPAEGPIDGQATPPPQTSSAGAPGK
jgi:hypothetical protein